jgi:hypothetical protein
VVVFGLKILIRLVWRYIVPVLLERSDRAPPPILLPRPLMVVTPPLTPLRR